MQMDWQYGKVVTEPLEPVSADEFYKSFLGNEWHHALVRLPPTQPEQKRLKVRVQHSASLSHYYYFLLCSYGVFFIRKLLLLCMT